VRPSFVSHEIQANAYLQRGGKWYSGYLNYYFEQQNFEQRKADEAYAKNTAADSAVGDAFAAKAAKFAETADSVNLWTTKADSLGVKLEYYTLAGLVVNARAALDLKAILSSSLFGPEDMRLYCEAAMLGVKDYPVFFDKPMQRVPVMFGVNLPGFRILDLVAVQAEYYASPWMNSYATVFGGVAIPEIPSGEDKVLSKNAYNEIGKKDNWAWSFLVKKKLAGAGWISAQLARDHMRLASQKVWGGPGWTSNEVLESPKDWYWMIQAGFGI
jgi:hypothetical protein